MLRIFLTQYRFISRYFPVYSYAFIQDTDSTVGLWSIIVVTFVLKYSHFTQYDKIMRKYKLFIGYRLLGEFSGIWEAKNFAAESGMSGIFSLVGENYRDSWYEPKKQDKNGNKD